VETFGVAGGKGYVVDSGECSHYALMNEDPSVGKTLQLASARKPLYTREDISDTPHFDRRFYQVDEGLGPSHPFLPLAWRELLLSKPPLSLSLSDQRTISRCSKATAYVLAWEEILSRGHEQVETSKVSACIPFEIEICGKSTAPEAQS